VVKVAGATLVVAALVRVRGTAPVFEPVTLKVITNPWSDVVSEYVVPVAPVIAFPFLNHAYVKVVPESQTPTVAVRILPTIAVPEIDGVGESVKVRADTAAVIALTLVNGT
jgi:hypothetical protein